MTEDWNAHRRALAEAQAWCRLHLNIDEPETSLRSAALKPAGSVPDNLASSRFQRRKRTDQHCK
ncbi:MAG: hypothetical protein ACR2J4_09980, partial [Deinococcus sp.]